MSRVWTRWSDHRPPNQAGSFRYRVRAEILGAIMMPEWTEKMSLCGMGYGESEYWPLTPCRWDGYRRYITHAGLEWSEVQDDDSEHMIWNEVNFLPCPFTGEQPSIVFQGRYIGAPVWYAEALWISSPVIPRRRWTNAAKMIEVWNTRI